jgi:DNA polymerase-1
MAIARKISSSNFQVNSATGFLYFSIIFFDRLWDSSPLADTMNELFKWVGYNPRAIVSANSPTFLLVDGHSLAFRAYYAFAKGRDGGLRTQSGIPTSVCYGFLKALLEVMDEYQPQAVAIAFDLAEPTFRHEADTNYKSDRAETPADLLVEIPNLQELLRTLNLQVITQPGYEADDILGTLATRASQENYTVKILSGDRDLFQLVSDEDRICVLYLSPGKGNKTTEFHPEQVVEKLGIKPEQVVDYKALCGDKSDNIPGVKGIGEKTAVKLLTQYHTLEGIYEAIDTIKGANQKKLAGDRDAAYHSQHLAKIVRDIPLTLSLKQCHLQGFDTEKIQPLFEKYEFHSFLEQIDRLQQQFGGQVTPKSSQERSQTSPDLNGGDTWFFSAEDTATSQQQARDANPIDPQIIDTYEQLNRLVEQLKTYTDPEHPVAWDTETTDLEPRDAQLVGIGCCWGSGKEDLAYIPIGHKHGKNLELDRVITALKPILETADYPKTLHNAKFDRAILHCQGIELDGVSFETMLASYVLNPEGTHNLAYLARVYLNLSAQSYKDLVPKGKTIADLGIPEVANYCGMDVHSTYLLVSKLRAELQDSPKLYEVLFKIEQPLEPVLTQMESVGIRIDTEYLARLSDELEEKLSAIENRAYDVAGETFNLGSPKQLSEILFEKLGLNRKKSRKTKTGYSTDAATLEKLQGDHEIIDLILEHRTLSKLKSTYVDALPQLVRAETRRVHTDFNQTATATGRLSSSNPNLQNIPIRTEFSRQIRQAFLPEQDWLLVSADYSQIELRILAHLSQEPVLISAYKNNEDVHTLTSKLLFEKEDISSEERRVGKTINFGVIYGMGAQRFARSIGVSTAQGKAFIDRFYDRYPNVFEYLETVKKEAIARGYVETIFGRRRNFYFAGESLQQLKGTDPAAIDFDNMERMNYQDAGLLRAAANAPIQGSSADIIKIAMVKIDELLQPYQARLLLQVHDELVFEVPHQEWEELQPKIKEMMEKAVELTVPLVVDIHAGKNWMEAK